MKEAIDNDYELTPEEDNDDDDENAPIVCFWLVVVIIYFFIDSNAHICVVCYLPGFCPFATIAVEGVGAMLPQSTINKNHVQADKDAAKSLIVKWLIPEGILGVEWSWLMTSLVPTLWKEWGWVVTSFYLCCFSVLLKLKSVIILGKFCNHKDGYNKDYMWMAVAYGKTPPHLRHSYFSGHMKLQKLACQVRSKSLGLRVPRGAGRNSRRSWVLSNPNFLHCWHSCCWE